MDYDIRLALMTGVDIPIPECNLVIHQPTIKEISFMGEKEYFLAIQTLSLDKKSLVEDETLLADLTNFNIFMTIMTDKTSLDKKKTVQQVFSLLFPNYSVSMTGRSIIFILKNDDENNQPVMIDENNFDIFQEIIKQICCLGHNSMQKSGFNPQDKRAKEIADKLMRARQRVAAQKGDNSDGSLLGQYLSVVTVGIGAMSLENCLNLTMYQLFDLVERYSLYTAWDIDMKVRLAGGKSDKEPDNWMKNIH